jgi:hypothetical protein
MFSHYGKCIAIIGLFSSESFAADVVSFSDECFAAEIMLVSFMVDDLSPRLSFFWRIVCS